MTTQNNYFARAFSSGYFYQVDGEHEITTPSLILNGLDCRSRPRVG